METVATDYDDDVLALLASNTASDQKAANFLNVTKNNINCEILSAANICEMAAI